MTEFTAKQRVLEWVRSKNPQTMDKDFEILGSDMGLQELLIAWIAKVDEQYHPHSPKERDHKYQWGSHKILGQFDLTENLHNQSEDFYENILSLISND
jgi:hypothetical protein